MFSFLMLLAASLATVNGDIGFVYEIVRHGARAASIPDPGKFKVPKSDLTQSGMRQRFMLGSYNRQKYIIENNLMDPEFNP